MDVRLLDPPHLDSVYATYLEAFSDYSIPIRPPRSAFEGMLQRRGANWKFSVGAFDGPRLVGLQIMALGEFGPEGTSTAYDVLTGVIPSHRGRGLATVMFERALEYLQPIGPEQILLECIQSNTIALSVYRRQGFEITRSFDCLEIPERAFHNRANAANVAIRQIESPAWVRLGDLRTWQPAWQNSNGCLVRARPAPTVLGAYRDDELVGYAAIFCESGDLAQFAVGRDHHHEGVGSALFAACIRRLKKSVERIRIVNVPIDAEADLAFFHSRGAKSFARQYEMARRG